MLAAPIGSGSIRNPYNIRIIPAIIKAPVIIDAGGHGLRRGHGNGA